MNICQDTYLYNVVVLISHNYAYWLPADGPMRQKGTEIVEVITLGSNANF